MSEQASSSALPPPPTQKALAAIYRPYVEGTAITFEYEVPTTDEFRSRISHTLERYPYLVATDREDPGRILGYAYAGMYYGRAAYAWSAETSIYVDRAQRAKGIGRALYAGLEEKLSQMGIQNMYACITALPEDRTEDPYLGDASIRFHERLGYALCARFARCGYKFGQWYDVVWMERMIGTHPTPAPALPWMS
jgi:phosphinothricin acetyltransferase